MRSLLLCLAIVSCGSATELSPVFRLPGDRLITSNQFGFQENRDQVLGAAFRAVVTNVWLPQLIPIFNIERKGRFELHRLPPRGQANITEPFFFALPPLDETNAAALSGRWKCQAKRGDGALVYPDFELAVDDTKVAARFDQSTEFRFAFITEGSFVSNRLELRIENVSDHYQMIGLLEERQLSGTWRHLEGTEQGSWKAERDLPAFVPPEPSEIVDLYEWKDGSGSTQYMFEGIAVEGWTRTIRPLCRVWRPKP
jgi:hypothetical protein